MAVLAILQARMTSSRLPGKVLMEIEGMPMIGRQIERVRETKLVDNIVVATSTDATDDDLALYLQSIGANVHRGELDDVLQRFIGVLENFECKTAVRLTADCPLTDPEVIDCAVEKFLNTDSDYLSNTLERTFPRGLDVEVFDPAILREVADTDFRPMSREHVTFGIYTRPDLYSLSNFSQDPSHANLRWTVDTQEDLDFVRNVYRNLLPTNEMFWQSGILAWLEQFPKFAHFENGEKS
jgi:spore coat polysaccharide biosynthesis protein SpsF